MTSDRQQSSDQQRDAAPETVETALVEKLKELLRQEPIAFLELVQAARKGRDVYFGNTRDILYKWEFIDSSFEMHSAVKSAIVIHVIEEGVGLRFK